MSCKAQPAKDSVLARHEDRDCLLFSNSRPIEMSSAELLSLDDLLCVEELLSLSIQKEVFLMTSRSSAHLLLSEINTEASGSVNGHFQTVKTLLFLQ